jgi:hypothetical protein
LRYSRPAKIVAKNEVTMIESILLSSPEGVKEPRSSESELFTTKLSITENSFCYDQKANYSPTIKIKGNARKKLSSYIFGLTMSTF